MWQAFVTVTKSNCCWKLGNLFCLVGWGWGNEGEAAPFLSLLLHRKSCSTESNIQLLDYLMIVDLVVIKLFYLYCLLIFFWLFKICHSNRVICNLVYLEKKRNYIIVFTWIVYNYRWCLRWLDWMADYDKYYPKEI